MRQVNECALSLDEGVGRVMAALKESGQLENTLVVFTADQGFSMGEHGFRTKLAPYEANFRSPLIVSRPGTIPQGKVCQRPVGGQDLVVTFFAHAGFELPWPMHGRDFSPLLANPERTDWSHPVLFEHTGQDFGSDVTKVLAEKDKAEDSNVPWWLAVRDGKYKYIRNLKAGEIEELYDLDADPKELTNLAMRSEHRATLERLRRALLGELKRTGAEFIEHLPPTAAMTAR